MIPDSLLILIREDLNSKYDEEEGPKVTYDACQPILMKMHYHSRGDVIRALLTPELYTKSTDFNETIWFMVAQTG